MKESALYKRLRENLTDCQITRIESRINLGIPDCLVCFENRFFMLELKIAKGKKVSLSPHQVSFHLKNHPTFFLVATEKELLLFKGNQAIGLKKNGTEEPALESWTLRKVDWEIMKSHFREGGKWTTAALSVDEEFY